MGYCRCSRLSHFCSRQFDGGFRLLVLGRQNFFQVQILLNLRFLHENVVVRGHAILRDLRFLHEAVIRGLDVDLLRLLVGGLHRLLSLSAAALALFLRFHDLLDNGFYEHYKDGYESDCKAADAHVGSILYWAHEIREAQDVVLDKQLEPLVENLELVSPQRFEWPYYTQNRKLCERAEVQYR